MAELTSTCPNCGAPKQGAFCHACGQSARSYLRSAHHIAGDYLAESFELDSRLWRTLHLLLLKPGALTNEFSRNRRASYVSPARLYLIVSLVFFSVLSLTSDLRVITLDLDAGRDIALEGRDSDFMELFARMTPEQRERTRTIIEERGLVTEEMVRQLDALERRPPPAQAASPMETRVRDHLLDSFEDPATAADAVIRQLPVALFLVLPFYAGWLKLMYRTRFYSEHLVFAFHLHAFLFTIGTLMLLLPDGRFQQLGLGVLEIIAAVYYFLALKAVYRESFPLTALKFVLINIEHLFLILVAVGLTVVATLIV